MVKPSSFILNTDYATLANDDSTTVQITVPSGVVVAGAGTYIQSTDVTIGSKASINRIQFSSSKDSNTRYSAVGFMGWARTGEESGFPAPYELYAIPYRVSPGTLRVAAYIPNPYGGALTGEAGDETITFYIDTFIPPYADV